MALGKQIKHYREKKGWTLEQLEDLSGVAVGSISALENRDSSRSKFFPAIAKALGLSVEQLQDESRDWLDQPQSDDHSIGIALPAALPDIAPAVETIAQAIAKMSDAERAALTGKLTSLVHAPDSSVLKKSISESLGSPPGPQPDSATSTTPPRNTGDFFQR